MVDGTLARGALTCGAPPLPRTSAVVIVAGSAPLAVVLIVVKDASAGGGWPMLTKTNYA
jgi:hypothetical protein